MQIFDNFSTDTYVPKHFPQCFPPQIIKGYFKFNKVKVNSNNVFLLFSEICLTMKIAFTVLLFWRFDCSDSVLILLFFNFALNETYQWIGVTSFDNILLKILWSILTIHLPPPLITSVIILSQSGDFLFFRHLITLVISSLLMLCLI